MQTHIVGGHPWPARLAYVAAGLFIVASTGTNLFYGIAKGTDAVSSFVWAAVSVAVSIVFALSWPALLAAIDHRRWSRAVMVAVALALTGAYSVTAALGSAAGGRANAASMENATKDARKKAQEGYDDAKAELATLKASRPVAEIEAIIARNPEAGGRCAFVNGSMRTVCPPHPLAPELARAKRRAELEVKIERATDELASAAPARVANSDAKALARYLAAIGLDTTPERLNDLLVLLAVLVIEMGGGLSLAIGMALGEGHPRTRQPEPAIGNSEGTPAEQPTERLNASPERPSQTASSIAVAARSPALNERPARSAHERVLATLRSKDGVLFGSQGALGASFGWSKTRMNEVLHELQSAGRVRLSTSRQGTAVRLVGGTA